MEVAQANPIRKNIAQKNSQQFSRSLSNENIKKYKPEVHIWRKQKLPSPWFSLLRALAALSGF